MLPWGSDLQLPWPYKQPYVAEDSDLDDFTRAGDGGSVMGFFDWFSPPKPAPVVIIRNVLGEEIDRVEGVRDLWGNVDLRGRQWAHAELSGLWLDGSDLSGANLFGSRCVGTSFARCNLKNANLAYARIEGGQFSARRSRGRGSSLHRRQARAIRRRHHRAHKHHTVCVRWREAGMVRRCLATHNAVLEIDGITGTLQGPCKRANPCKKP